MPLIVETFGLSDVGRVREINEDNFLCWNLGSPGSEGPSSFFLLGVADGIGGHAGGAVASGTAVEVVKGDLMEWAAVGPRPDVKAALAAVFQRANRQIFERAAATPELAGMGTTLVAAVVDGGAVTIANVGDSRAYQVRDGRLLQITRDHSWIAEQRRRNSLSERDLRNSPFKSMITRSLGFHETVEVDIYTVEAAEDDVLLFCTDGLYGPLPEKRILKIIKHKKNPKDICPALVQTAKEIRGDDNITAVAALFRGNSRGRKAALFDTVRLGPRPKDDVS
jgi:protein phosphatase